MARTPNAPSDTKLVKSSEKRRPPAAGRGRQAGAKNKATKALKEMILAALDDAGGQVYLAKQAAENPKAFLTLIGRVLPTEVKADVQAAVTVSGRIDWKAVPLELRRAIANLPIIDK